jgi:hypothetical protein
MPKPLTPLDMTHAAEERLSTAAAELYITAGELERRTSKDLHKRAAGLRMVAALLEDIRDGNAVVICIDS